MAGEKEDRGGDRGKRQPILMPAPEQNPMMTFV
jgi:hypothetical protein